MSAPSPNDLRELLERLSAGPSDPEQWRQWHIQPVSGGANNLLYRATGPQDDFAVKFAIRDERDRAGREYGALLALQGRQLAPDPIFLDPDSYAQPVVVQRWLPGEMAQEPPQTDDEWSVWLAYLAKVHELGPEHAPVDLQSCWDNGNGAEGLAKSIASLRQTARAEQLPSAIVALTNHLAKLRLDRWRPVPPRLCRADHNTRNFIRHNDTLKSVDWEYGGWGDPAEDIAELMAHATYMSVPDARWPSVVEEYARLSPIANVAARIQLCLAIKLVGWAVRCARALAPTSPDRARLVPLKGEWRLDTRVKCAYYLQRAQNHLEEIGQG